MRSRASLHIGRRGARPRRSRAGLHGTEAREAMRGMGTVTGTLLGMLGALLVALGSVCPADALGENAGIRLLLHVDDAFIPANGEVTTNPCEQLPGVTRAEQLRVDYDGDQDTVWAWVYLHRPPGMAVKGLGFGIQYEGVDVITSGTCADLVFQEPATMGTWADSGSEIAFAWSGQDYVDKPLEPIAWFLLERLDRDGFFSLYPGGSDMAGAVGDTNTPAKTDEIWAYGSLGFGETVGELPLTDPEGNPGSWGTIRVEIE